MSGFPNPSQFPGPDLPQRPSAPPRKSSKTIYWVAGCLGLLLIGAIAGIAVIGLFGLGIYSGVNAVANSEAYKAAQEHVRQSPKAKAEFGDQMQFGSYPSSFN